MALEENTSAESGISRRTIVKGAAWAAPVMIAAVAVPAAVASVNALTGISKTSPTGNLPKNASFTEVKLAVTPAFSGSVYLALDSTDPASNKFYFTNSTGSTSSTTATVTFTSGTATIYLKTPNGNNKTATLSATTSSTPQSNVPVSVVLRTANN